MDYDKNYVTKMASKEYRSDSLELKSLKNTDSLSNSKSVTISGNFGSIEQEHDTPMSPSSQSSTDKEEKLSNLQGLIHLIKAFVATGYLSLPFAVKQIGIWAGFGFLIATGIITESCVLLLAKSFDVIKKRHGLESLDYAGLMGLVFENGPCRMKRFSKRASMVVNMVLVIGNMAYSSVYLDLMATYLSQVVSYYHDGYVNQKTYLSILTLAILPLCCVNSLKILMPFSTIANISNFAIFIIVFQYIVQDLPDVSARPAFKAGEGFMLYAGFAMFAFEGITMVIPLANRMNHPKDFGGWDGVTGLACTIFSVSFTAIGFYGYLRFGEDTLPSVVLNLPTDERLYRSVKILGLVVLASSITLTIYVPKEILWGATDERCNSQWWANYGEYVIRSGIVLIMFCITMVVPDVGLLMPFVGALCGSSVSFIFPPLIMMLIKIMENPTKVSERLKKVLLISYCSVLLCIGLLGAGAGTYVAMWQILQYYKYGKAVSPH